MRIEERERARVKASCTGANETQDFTVYLVRRCGFYTENSKQTYGFIFIPLFSSHTVAFVITDPTHFQQELTHMFVCVCVSGKE